MRRVLLVVTAAVLSLAAAAPAEAQRDRMSMGEQLGAQVLRGPGPRPKTIPAPAATPPPGAARDRVKLSESITSEKR